MTRRLRPLTIDDLGRLPAGCGGCAFWETAEKHERRCGSFCDLAAQKEWLRRVTSEWGECGRVAYEDDELLGFIKYAPSGYFPQASTFAGAPQDPRMPLISCLHVSSDARHHGLGTVLLRAAMKDLIGKGEKRVEAFGYTDLAGSAVNDMPMLGVPFLLRNGFVVSRPDATYPLMRLDLKSLALWQESLESVLESLRFPLRVPSHAPASLIEGR